MIERKVPPGGKVFSFEQIPEAWTTREIFAGYTSAQNEVLSDTLAAALSLESASDAGTGFPLRTTAITAAASDPNGANEKGDVECQRVSGIRARHGAAG